MTEEMEEFEKLLKMDTPPASADAKKSAISKGMEAFDQQFSQKAQGISSGDRLMDAVRTFHNTIFGDKPMKSSQLIAGGFAIALGVLLLNSSNLTPLLPQSETDKTLQPSPIQPATSQVDPRATYGRGAASVTAQDAAKKSENIAVLEKEIAEQKNKGDRVDSLEAAPQRMAAEKAMAMPTAPSMPAPASAMTKHFSGAVEGSMGGMVQQIAPADMSVSYYRDEGRDKFEHVKANPVKVAKEEPVSTFSIDVDTSSYAFMRASINTNVLPQKDAVRIEELVNYFPYEYEVPANKETPFKANVAVIPTPWNSKTKLIHIGIKGYQIEQKEKPRANLVFLVDTSGSMNEPNKLPLLKNSLKLLLDSLKPEDSVAIVTYAGSAGVALEPTSLKDKAKILTAIDNFNAGGSTAGAEGIRTAYQLAEKSFDKTGVNRVILATDGDFNVGITDPSELKSFVERQRSTGIFLSVLGFGQGNYNDAMMQTLAQNGNGNAAYIDNLSEARKTLVEEASSTLFTIAKDVKIQVEFNPAKVAEYRLIGYETRILNREDFNNDKVDAGDIGSGHTVTALYEITPPDSDAKLVDNLRYQAKEDKKETSVPTPTDEYAFVKIRYKLPESDTSTLITTPVDGKTEFKELAAAPQEARFASAVAAYGQLLRGDAYTQKFTFDDVIALAQGAKGTDNFGYRAEFINLVRLAGHAAKLPAQQGGGYGYVVPASPEVIIQPAPMPIR
jgi:Ca-activated chloride channel homolog